MFRLAADLLIRPGRAVDSLKEGGAAFRRALGLYAFYLAAAVLFYAWKPADFPPPPDPAQALPGGGILFWAQVHAWEPLFTAVWVVFAAWFSRILAGGRLPLRLFGSALVLLVPLLLNFSPDMGAGPALYRLLWVGFLAALLPGLRGVDRGLWLALSSLIMAVNVVSVALLPFSAAAVLFSEPMAFTAAELAALFWSVGLTTFGMSRLTALSGARAFCVTVFSLASQMLVIVFLKNLGVLPTYVFKAMMAL